MLNILHIHTRISIYVNVGQMPLSTPDYSDYLHDKLSAQPLYVSLLCAPSLTAFYQVILNDLHGHEKIGCMRRTFFHAEHSFFKPLCEN